MDKEYYRPSFVKKAGPEGEIEKVSPSYDSSSEWKADPKGYFLIKVFYKQGKIGARFCSYDDVPRKDIVGENAEEIVQTIVREGLVSSMQHVAYLGMELQRAETACKLGIEFVQCKPLDYNKKTSKDESDNLPE